MTPESQRIVVVEDDPGMSRAIERILRAAGFAAELFSSAEALVDADAAHDADCLVLDIQLPGMSGFELYRQLARTLADLPAVFITGHDSAAVRHEAAQIGTENYLVKPFSGRSLLRALDHALGCN